MKGYFITGTGTGVGKTYVTATLARHARGRGQRVFAFKPIETGCTRENGQLVGLDQSLLCEASGGWQTDELRGVYRFEPGVAPAVAAREARIRVELQAIQSALLRGVRQSDLVLVEGAGGWRVPISDTEDMSDLARLCELPVIIVSHAGLGAINHTLLTIEAVEKTQPVSWVVLSQRSEDDPSLVQTNIEEIAKRWTARIVALDAGATRVTVLDRLLD